jgi:hypothetical protein
MVRTVTILLGTAGILLLLAGPAFHVIDSKQGLFGGVSAFVIAAAFNAIFKKKDKK